MQVIQVDEDMRSEVAQQISEGRGKLSEFGERRVAAEDMLKRIDIRSPQDGVLYQLEVHTVGGVVSPGEPIMMIVPEADQLTVEARVSPTDIDQLQPDQHAMLHFSAFNQRTTPVIPGNVSRIGADLSEDPHTGARYFLVRVAMDQAKLPALHGLKLVPGMPVEAFMETEPRTVISFLVKPLRDQIARAFRET